MASWREVEEAAPDLAREVRERFAVRKHATIATLRASGGPRISGTEVAFANGEVTVGSMPGAVKANDLRRDPRFALHSPTVDPPSDDPEGWPGEAKLAGRAFETPDPGEGLPGEYFRLDVTEVVLTRVAGGQLEIRSWHEGRGEEVRRRD